MLMPVTIGITSEQPIPLTTIVNIPRANELLFNISTALMFFMNCIIRVMNSAMYI